MDRIERRNPNDKEISMPLICSTFSCQSYVIQPNDEVRNLNEVCVGLSIHDLKENSKNCVIYLELELNSSYIVILSQMTINIVKSLIIKR